MTTVSKVGFDDEKKLKLASLSGVSGAEIREDYNKMFQDITDQQFIHNNQKNFVIYNAFSLLFLRQKDIEKAKKYNRRAFALLEEVDEPDLWIWAKLTLAKGWWDCENPVRPLMELANFSLDHLAKINQSAEIERAHKILRIMSNSFPSIITFFIFYLRFIGGLTYFSVR